MLSPLSLFVIIIGMIVEGIEEGTPCTTLLDHDTVLCDQERSTIAARMQRIMENNGITFCRENIRTRTDI